MVDDERQKAVRDWREDVGRYPFLSALRTDLLRSSRLWLAVNPLQLVSNRAPLASGIPLLSGRGLSFVRNRIKPVPSAI